MEAAGMRALAFIIILLFLTTPRVPIACSCAPVTPKEAFDASACVFDGVVIGSTEIGEFREGKMRLGSTVQYTFEVSKIWKGEVADTLRILTSKYPESCGVRFNVGDRYIVYAYRPNISLFTSLCSGNMPMNDKNLNEANFPKPIWTKKKIEKRKIEKKN